MSDDLRRLAERASADPFFLGFVLAAYQRRHGLDDRALARQLGAHDTAVAAALRLCRRPGTDAPYRSARQDVDEIARRFGIDAEALWRVLEDAGDEQGGQQ
jgi:hypothetical protein